MNCRDVDNERKVVIILRGKSRDVEQRDEEEKQKRTSHSGNLRYRPTGNIRILAPEMLI